LPSNQGRIYGDFWSRVPDRVEEDHNDHERVDETERPLEQGNSKADGVGEKKQKKKRKRPVHHIESLKTR
jgi:hypothetical protein